MAFNGSTRKLLLNKKLSRINYFHIFNTNFCNYQNNYSEFSYNNNNNLGILVYFNNKIKLFDGFKYYFFNNSYKETLRPGDLVLFNGINTMDITDVIVKNPFACGFLSSCKKFIIPHGNKENIILIRENVFIPTEDISPNSVFLCTLDENGFCKKLKFIGNNNEIATQEICLYVNAGLGRYLDEVYTCQNIPTDFKDIEFDTTDVYDMTNHVTFCIDPIDAKDADDAISILKLSDNVYEIGIHVADVTRFTNNDDIKSASLKSNTWYLVNSCLPMFPKKFATSVVSFVPDKVRPSFSVVFKISKNDNTKINDYNIYDIKIVLGKIKVNYSISYGFAEKLIEAKTENELNKLTDLTGVNISTDVLYLFHRLYDFSTFLNQDRISKFDSIEFDHLQENLLPCAKNIKSIFDEKETKKSKMLVTEYMLHANNLVANFLAEHPNNLAMFRLCYSMNNISRDCFKEKVNFFKSIYKDKNIAFSDILSIGLLMSAYYSFINEKMPKKINHFPLGYPNYVHFTSPIRRFPDITVHFALKNLLVEKPKNGYIYENSDVIQKICNINSRLADTLFIQNRLADFHLYVIGNGEMITDAIFYSGKFYVPELNMTFMISEHSEVIDSFIECKIKLIPIEQQGFLCIQPEVLEIYPNRISSRDRNFLLYQKL